MKFDSFQLRRLVDTFGIDANKGLDEDSRYIGRCVKKRLGSWLRSRSRMMSILGCCSTQVLLIRCMPETCNIPSNPVDFLLSVPAFSWVGGKERFVLSRMALEIILKQPETHVPSLNVCLLLWEQTHHGDRCLHAKLQYRHGGKRTYTYYILSPQCCK